jgi:hypothetical protein
MYQSTETAVILEPAQIPIVRTVDVLVCGGGVAGLAAAVAAARRGAKTLLIERAGFLGGTATGSAMGLIVIPAEELRGFPREFFSRLAEENGAGLGDVVPWDIEAYKLVAMDMLTEAGAEVLLYTTVSEPLVKDDQITGVIIDGKSGRQAVMAKVVIDATGDGDVAARAGLPYSKGRETDGAMRPVTVMGRIGNINTRKFKEYIDRNPGDFSRDDGRTVVDIEAGIIRIDGFFSLVERAKREGLLPADSPINYLRFSGVNRDENAENAILICNTTRVYGVDGTDSADITKAEIEGRRQLRDVVRLCREYIPGFRNSILVDTSAFLGIRETRRIQGQYKLTYDDIVSDKRYEDSVCVIASVDYGTAEVHGPDHGHEGSANDEWARKMALDIIHFEFPLRCMIPRGISNLIIAGRCISVTHDVDKFARNMAPTGLVGQAAGTLAALASKNGQTDWNDLPVQELRSDLESQGVDVSLPVKNARNF